MPIPGVRIKTAANILLAVGDGSDFPDAVHLDTSAGIAPVTRRSGTSIRGEFPARSGEKKLKNALFRSAWVASNCNEATRAYYAKKQAEDKRHNVAVISLARRRRNVIFTMLTRGEFFRELPARTPQKASATQIVDLHHAQPRIRRSTVTTGGTLTPARSKTQTANAVQVRQTSAARANNQDRRLVSPSTTDTSLYLYI